MTPLFLSHELYLIYDPQTDLGRRTRAFAPSLCGVVHDIDINSNWVTPLRWKEVVDILEMASVKELINEGHPDFQSLIGDKDFNEQDLLEVLSKNPQLVKGPVAVLQNHAVLCDNPTDILKLDNTPEAERQSYSK